MNLFIKHIAKIAFGKLYTILAFLSAMGLSTKKC